MAICYINIAILQLTLLSKNHFESFEYRKVNNSIVLLGCILFSSIKVLLLLSFINVKND